MTPYDDTEDHEYESDDEGDYYCDKCDTHWNPEYEGRRCPQCGE